MDSLCEWVAWYGGGVSGWVVPVRKCEERFSLRASASDIVDREKIQATSRFPSHDYTSPGVLRPSKLCGMCFKGRCAIITRVRGGGD